MQIYAINAKLHFHRCIPSVKMLAKFPILSSLYQIASKWHDLMFVIGIFNIVLKNTVVLMTKGVKTARTQTQLHTWLNVKSMQVNPHHAKINCPSLAQGWSFAKCNFTPCIIRAIDFQPYCEPCHAGWVNPHFCNEKQYIPCELLHWTYSATNTINVELLKTSMPSWLD